MIPEIDIWRIANLMLKRYGDEADIESALRAEELAEEGDHSPSATMLAKYKCPAGAAGCHSFQVPNRKGSVNFLVQFA